jgi:Transposase C of IS166 homeodomain
MKLDLNNLPSGDKITHQIIRDLVQVLTIKAAELALKKAELALLKEKLYGKSSEKLKKKVADLEQQIQESESEIAEQNQDDDHAGEDDATDENLEDSSSFSTKLKKQDHKLRINQRESLYQIIYPEQK